MLLEFFFILDFGFNVFWSNWFILGVKNFEVCLFWREKIDVIRGIIGESVLGMLFYLGFLVIFNKFWFLLVNRFCLLKFCVFFKLYGFLILVFIFKVLFKGLMDVNRLFELEFFFFSSGEVVSLLLVDCWVIVLFGDFFWRFLYSVVFENLRRLLFIFE